MNEYSVFMNNCSYLWKMEVTGKSLRKVAGAFPTGVTVITTATETGDVHGMTVSSFQSVSLEPPLVSFYVKEIAKTFSLLSNGKAVGISILGEDQADVSSQFAGFTDEHKEVKMKTLDSGLQVIDNALGWYGTVVEDMIKLGDHYLILCKVQELGRQEEGAPLIYWSGYKSIKNEIPKS